MSELDNPKRQGPVRLQRGLSRAAEEGTPIIRYNFLDLPPDEAVRAIVDSANKIDNEGVRRFYTLRALRSIGHEGGRELTPKELDVLIKYIRGDAPLTDEDLLLLDTSEPSE
jgi:hypothetical protein